MSDYIWTKDAAVPDPSWPPFQGPPTLEQIKFWAGHLGETISLSVDSQDYKPEHSYTDARLAASMALGCRFYVSYWDQTYQDWA